MADEAALKKQLETCEDFTERREIRKRLRELRERKNNQPEAEVESNPHRTRRERHVEETTRTSSDGVTVKETHTTKTKIIENGDVVKEEEVVKITSKDEPEEPDGGGQEPDDRAAAAEAEAELEAELEEELEEELKEELKEELEEEEPAPEEEEAEDIPPYAQKSPQDLTERDIEEIDDLDFLEATLNDLPLKFFDVRKFLRARIRKVKVNQGGSKQRLGGVARAKGQLLTDEKKEERRERSRETTATRKTFQGQKKLEKNSKKEDTVRNSHLDENRNLKIKDSGNKDLEAKENGEKDIKETGEKEIEKPASDHSKKSRPEGKKEEFTIEEFASDTLLNRLDETDAAKDENKDPEVYSEDEDSSLTSPSATSSTSDVDNPPASPGVKEDDSPKSKGTITVITPAHKIDALETGKKKTDFKSQLKKTGLSPRMDLTSATKKPAPEKIDLRKNLKSVGGGVPLTRKGSWSEKYGPSLRDGPSKPRTQEEPANVGGTRRISSSDLFNLIGKPVEPKPNVADSWKQATPKQPFKYEPPKVVEPKDENFESIMAHRKKSSSRQFSPADLKVKSSPSRMSPAWSPKQLRKATYVPSMPKGTRNLSVDGKDVKDGRDHDLPDEDIDDMLKDVDVTELELQEQQTPVPLSKRKTSSGNIKWVEGPQIDIQDKSQLSQLRQQLEQQKKEKEAAGPSVKTTTTKTTEVRHDGAGGTTTVTKTTKTREASGGIGKGGLRNFEAEMAKKKKERQSAKAQAFKSAKDKRNAFKDQLEASNPKPAGGVKKSFGSPNTAVNALLEWCRRKTRGYENVEIQNYTTSWADGLAMCALFHNFSPNLIPWETLNPKERKRNWTLAFDAAYAEGMDPLLELEDVLSCAVPEPRSLITYIHSIYQHFHDKAEKAKQEREQKA